MNSYFCEVGANLSKNIKQPVNGGTKAIARNPKTIFICPHTYSQSKISFMKMPNETVHGILLLLFHSFKIRFK